MKKTRPLALVIIFLGLYTLTLTIFWFPTDGYKEAMKYLKFGILLLSFLITCYGFFMLLKKQ